jgi:hypothetical protein
MPERNTASAREFHRGNYVMSRTFPAVHKHTHNAHAAKKIHMNFSVPLTAASNTKLFSAIRFSRMAPGVQ